MSFTTRTYYIYFRFHIKDLYSERELEELLETLERRGGNYVQLEPGWYELEVAPQFGWMPFYKTLKECWSVEQVDWVPFAVAANKRRIGKSGQIKQSAERPHS